MGKKHSFLIQNQYIFDKAKVYADWQKIFSSSRVCHEFSNVPCLGVSVGTNYIIFSPNLHLSVLHPRVQSTFSAVLSVVQVKRMIRLEVSKKKRQERLQENSFVCVYSSPV